MTREEAIYELETMKTLSKDLSDDEIEALKIAIKALNEVIKSENFVKELMNKAFSGTSYEEWCRRRKENK